MPPTVRPWVLVVNGSLARERQGDWSASGLTKARPGFSRGVADIELSSRRSLYRPARELGKRAVVLMISRRSLLSAAHLR
jgi:hypothetical protein